MRSLELMSNDKLKLEDKIVQDLKKQMLTNKSCININKKINEIKKKSLNLIKLLKI